MLKITMIPKATLHRILAVVAVLLVAPPIGLLFARDTNKSNRVAAPNTAIQANAGVAAGPAGRELRSEFAGVLLPPKMANVAPTAEGRVESVAVKVGQVVHQGDVILRFDPRQRKHELAMAQASLKAAQAAAGAAASEMQAARRRAARRNATVEVNGQTIPIVSGEEVAQAQSDARTAAARAGSAGASIGEAQARVQALSLALDEAEVKAPFDGIVTAILFEPGMNVHANETVARVVGGSGLRLRFAVPEEDAAILKGRGRARIALESSVLYATIEQVSPEVEPASRAFVVEGTVEGGDAACGVSGCAMVAGRGVRVSLEPGPSAMTAVIIAPPPATITPVAAPPEVAAAPQVAAASPVAAAPRTAHHGRSPARR